ncbi:MAG: hypothetical protein ACRDZ7_21545 [Acidimicrobiia bacterium]
MAMTMTMAGVPATIRRVRAVALDAEITGPGTPMTTPEVPTVAPMTETTPRTLVLSPGSP